MRTARPGRSTIILAIVLTTALKLCLVFFTYGTNDAGVWDAGAKLVREGKAMGIYGDLLYVNDSNGRYLHRQIYNHPPFMIYVLRGLNGMQDATGTTPHVSIRLLDTAADAGTLVLTTLIADALCGATPVWPFVMVALAPAWIFISGFHSNSDPLMLFFLVLTVYVAEVRRLDFAATISFTLATGIKIVPLLMLPAFLFYLDSTAKRVRALATLGVFWAITAIPWLLHTPRGFIRNIFLYRSIGGQWGIGMILTYFPPFRYAAERAFNRLGIYILLIALTAAGWAMNRGARRVPLFYQFGILLFLFLFLTSGFGIQYLAWLSPWIVVLPAGVVAVHIAMAGLFSGAVYTYWTHGVPWYYANAILSPPWRGFTKWCGLLAWITTGIVLVAYWRRLKRWAAQAPTLHGSEADHGVYPGGSAGRDVAG